MPDAERTPADRYAQLPEYVRDLLEDLRPEEVDAIRFVSRLSPSQRDLVMQGMTMVTSVTTVSKLVKWGIVGLVAGLLLISQGIDALQKIWAWMTR